MELPGLVIPVASETFPEIVTGGLVDLGERRIDLIKHAADEAGDRAIAIDD